MSSNSGSRGGGEIYLRYLAAGLAGLGCEVHALLGSDRAMDELAAGLSGDARVHRLPLTNTFARAGRSLAAALDPGQRRRVRRFIEKLAPDISHVNQQVAEDALDLLLAAADAGPALVTTIHVTHPAAGLGARMGALRDLVAERALARLAPPVIVVSAADGARLRRRPRLAAADVTVVHAGVPDAAPAACAEARRRARRDWGLSGDEVAIGAAGRLEEQKNPLFLVDLFADLAGNREGRLIWIGDGALRRAMERRAAERGVLDRLVIDGWRDDARLRLAGLDVVAMPSRFEGLPLALLEAMHAGLPACVSDADGMPEAITDGHDGFVRALSDPDGWREAVAGLLDDAGLRARFGRAARETALRRFSLGAMASATLALYRRTTGETAGETAGGPARGRVRGRDDALAG